MSRFLVPQRLLWIQGLDRGGAPHDLEVGAPALGLDPEFERPRGVIVVAFDDSPLRGMKLEAHRPVPARPGWEEA